MKIKNKETGEIGKIAKTDDEEIEIITDTKVYLCKSLSEVCQHWEDYEDELFYIVSAEHKDGYICVLKEDYKGLCDVAKKIGIGFETEKEARQAVKKLKAWKRLKDNGFRLDAVVDTFFCLDIYMCGEPYEAIKDDLKIVFGNEK